MAPHALKRLCAAVLSAAILALCCFCASAVAAAEQGGSSARLVGRFKQLPGGDVEFGWPGSAMEIAFEGTSLSVRFEDNGKNSFVVELDGSVSRLDLRDGDHQYQLATGLRPTHHLVRMVRRTEGQLGTTTYRGAVTDGAFLPPPNRTRRLLVVGDSISAGYGVEGTTATCDFSPDTENQYLTYGALAARAFGADVVTLAWSGRGLVRNYHGDPGETVPQMLDRVIPIEAAVAEDGPYDVIVINLGTNDVSGDARPRKFKGAFLALLTRLRAQSPHAFVFAAVGPMLSGDARQAVLRDISSAVRQRQRLGDARVSVLELSGIPEEEGGAGCNGHPNAASHLRMAKTLIEAITEQAGWKQGDESRGQ